MTAIIFFILFIAVLFAWNGNREFALTSFALVFVLSIVLFIHHITSTIGLSL